MEDSKLAEILKKVMSKASNMLDETFAKFEHNLRNDIANLTNGLSSAKKLKPCVRYFLLNFYFLHEMIAL